MLAADLTLSEDVCFLGPLFGADKTAAFEYADAFILASFSEGFPMAVLEAWAHSLPVFMTDECNITEGFDAGAAIQVTTEPDALASVLADRLPAPDLPEIGAKGRALAAARFSWTAIAAELRTVYEWLAFGSPQPACVRLD